jgi:UDP-N-acetylmuramoyl-tripeptide--D-alanyl-D-alanine ligase
VAALAGEQPIALHPEPRRALGDFAAWHRSRLGVPVVGITGSCGKTTTKNVLRELLSARLSVVASPSSFNNDVGVPHTLLAADESTEVLVVELGTNAFGEIASLCRIARPTAGILTNVGASHLEGLGSLEGVAREKGDLAAALPGDGFLVLNADCRFTPEVRSRTLARVLTFSVEGDGELDAREVEFHAAGTSFRLDGHEVTSPLLGTHNVQNLLAALAACRGLGLELVDVLPAVGRLAGGRGRMERVELGGITLYDDTYNANPESARAAVRVLSGLHGGRRVLVLGDMLELGEFAAELHHAVGAEAARAGIDVLVLVGELTRATAAGALEEGLDPEALFHFDDAAEAAARVPELLRAGDIVLAKASRRVGLESVVGAVRARFPVGGAAVEADSARGSRRETANGGAH